MQIIINGHRVQKLLEFYGIESEAQLVSGQLSSVKNRLNEQEKNDYSYYNTDRVVQMRYAQLFDTYRRRFFEVSTLSQFAMILAQMRL